MHIDDNTLEKFQNNQMDTNDMIAFLEHLDKCDYCMEQMLDRETTDSPIAPPDYLKDQILARSSSLDEKNPSQKPLTGCGFFTKVFTLQ